MVTAVLVVGSHSSAEVEVSLEEDTLRSLVVGCLLLEYVDGQGD